RRGLEAPAVARIALRVAAVAAEQHADVHFVGLAFEPFEVAAHAIPSSVFPQLLRAQFPVLAEKNKILLGLGKLMEWALRVDLVFRTRAHKVALALASAFALERLHTAIGDADATVGDRAVEVDANDASEAAARRARTNGVVEIEQSGRRRRDLDIAPR